MKRRRLSVDRILGIVYEKNCFYFVLLIKFELCIIVLFVQFKIVRDSYEFG